MEILYLLIPLSFIILVAAISFFFWAVKAGQFDDLDGPAYRVLDEPEDRASVRTTSKM